jgi:SAM-dependent methyltransferase
MTKPAQMTDLHALHSHRARAKRQPVTFLHEEAATEIEERLNEVNRTFSRPALVGNVTSSLQLRFPDPKVIQDDELLSLEPTTHDLIIHCFALHWSNDPLGQIVQSRIALQPDGLFVAVLFGGNTLHELRTAAAEAEVLLTGGLSPRVLPMAELRDLGGLLQRSGLALPVADSRKLTVRYPNLAGLMHDLRGMGESNALLNRHKSTPKRAFFPLVEEVYHQHFSDSDGYLTATFDLIFLTGWAPAATQQQPLRPGSAKTRLAEVLGVEEVASGDNAAPE